MLAVPATLAHLATLAVPLQASTVSPIAVVGLLVGFSLFLSLTAHLAARNVLGDVAVRKALAVGPVPAIVSVLVATFDLPSLPGLFVALALDGVLVKYVYDQPPRLAAYVTLIHFTVTVILGVIAFGVLALVSSAPT